jgi:glutathione S-transferase
MTGYGSMKEVLDTLEGAVVGREFIVADRFSAADVYVGSHLTWGMMFGTVEKRPAFEQYVAKLHARPQSKRASELDDALAPPPGGKG